MLELSSVLKVSHSFIFILSFNTRFLFEDEVQKLSKKLQEAQTYNIHVVSEEFLKEITTDRPSVIMEKCKISTWGILPHVRQQSKVDEEEKKKSGRSSFTVASGKSDRSYSIHFNRHFLFFFFFFIQLIRRNQFQTKSN